MATGDSAGDVEAAVVLDADLSALNTFGLRAHAAACCACVRLRRFGRRSPRRAGATRRLVLGGGSNLVLGGDFAGTVLRWRFRAAACCAPRPMPGSSGGGGESWHDFVRWTLAGLARLENLSLIPGTVGAAPIQNIGAYGVELVERFESLDAVSSTRASCAASMPRRAPSATATACSSALPEGGWSSRCASACHGGARSRAMPMSRASSGHARSLPSALEVSDAVIAIRRRKLPDPAVLGNAGSFFKNPVVDAARAACSPRTPRCRNYPQADGGEKLAAGWLIEQAGWKGATSARWAVTSARPWCWSTAAVPLVPTCATSRRRSSPTSRARFGVRLEPNRSSSEPRAPQLPGNAGGNRAIRDGIAEVLREQASTLTFDV